MPAVSVSIVIPHFNRPQYLDRALGSLASQHSDGFNLQVIVVDDGSSEECKAKLQGIVNRLSAPRGIAIEWLPTNIGGGGARNHGIRLCSCDYIAFLDSDDEWLPEKLLRQIPFMQQHSLDFCASQFIEVFPDGSHLKLPTRPFLGDVGNYLFEQGGHFQTSTLVVKRELAQAVLFDESLRKFQDWNFAIRLDAATHRGAVLMTPLANYYSNHQGRISERAGAQYAISFYDRTFEMLSAAARFSFLSRTLPATLLADGHALPAFAALFRAYRSCNRFSIRNLLSLAKQFAVRVIG